MRVNTKEYIRELDLQLTAIEEFLLIDLIEEHYMAPKSSKDQIFLSSLLAELELKDNSSWDAWLHEPVKSILKKLHKKYQYIMREYFPY